MARFFHLPFPVDLRLGSFMGFLTPINFVNGKFRSFALPPLRHARQSLRMSLFGGYIQLFPLKYDSTFILLHLPTLK